jgi:alkanesulfonate monooxygenase SsuD/methylene tetrahydromethanopterin reductase-like flavin-dependent oxidoreductase (luciferase family)
MCDPQIAADSIARSVENAKIAEEVGFDWVSVSEHHFGPTTLTPSSTILAAAVGAATSRVKVAVLGPLLPLNNPVRLAEELSMVDSLNGGRTVVLFLRGTPNELVTYGDVAEVSRAMTQEGIELIIKAWSEPEPFSWKSSQYDFENIAVWPRSLQGSSLPVFASGNSPESAAWAAQHHLSIAMSFLPLDVAAKFIAIYREEAEKAGWTPTPDNILYRHFTHVAATDADAAREMGEAMAEAASHVPTTAEAAAEMSGSASAPPPEQADFRPYFFGGPETIVERARALSELGVGVLDLAFIIPGGERQGKSARVFGETALKAVQAL